MVRDLQGRRVSLQKGGFMFDQVFVAEAPGGKRFWTTCAGVTGQVALVCAMILAPMVWPEALPKPQALRTILLPSPPLPPPAPLAPQPVHAARAVPSHSFVTPEGHYISPVKPPDKIDMTPDEPMPVTGPFVPGAVPGGS